MKPRQTLTPAMLRTRYHERAVALARLADWARHPRPLANAREDVGATAQWLAHVQAGRIPVLSQSTGRSADHARACVGP